MERLLVRCMSGVLCCLKVGFRSCVARQMLSLISGLMHQCVAGEYHRTYHPDVGGLRYGCWLYVGGGCGVVQAYDVSVDGDLNACYVSLCVPART